MFASIACATCTGSPAAAQSETAADANPAAALRARYAVSDKQSGASQFNRPLYLDSVESPRDLKGDIYALVDHPFAHVNAALNSPAHWCDIMILHINTKYCRAASEDLRVVLTVRIGKKTEQALNDASRVDFVYRVVAATPDYLAIQLSAENGPLGTSNYRILLEAAPAENGRSILHLTYSYAYGLSGRLAMQAYLVTAGSGKVGFTVINKTPDGQAVYIDGVRGVVERNTMRYFLAIDAYLGALSAPPAEQLDKRLQSWFTSTETFARQLHEVDRTAYLDMKRNEYRRQQSVQ